MQHRNDPLRPRALCLAFVALAWSAGSLAAWQTSSESGGSTRADVSITLQFQHANGPSITDEVLFGHYLGTGTGTLSGGVEGRISWDLYEDQTRDDTHPALFKGHIEHEGTRYPFELIGVYVPEGDETVVTPTGQTTVRYWRLTAAIVLKNGDLIGRRSAPVSGIVDTGRGSFEGSLWDASAASHTR